MCGQEDSSSSESVNGQQDRPGWNHTKQFACFEVAHPQQEQRYCECTAHHLGTTVFLDFDVQHQKGKIEDTWSMRYETCRSGQVSKRPYLTGYASVRNCTTNGSNAKAYLSRLLSVSVLRELSYLTFATLVPFLPAWQMCAICDILLRLTYM